MAVDGRVPVEATVENGVVIFRNLKENEINLNLISNFSHEEAEAKHVLLLLVSYWVNSWES